jgi:hypothetical protein
VTDIDRRQDLLVALEQLKTAAAAALTAGEWQILAGLVREQRAVLKELEGLGEGQEASSVDDLRARREKRRQAAGM